ncbi:MAG: phospholipid N-methyltransferase [Polaribacter sp.]|jgi:phospholipid N-methyltransferase
MINSIKTSLSFTKNLFTVGSFKETSSETVSEICSKINPKKKNIIIEFGMGHGNMTKEILKTISSDSMLYSFEINPEFCKHVKDTIKDDRLQVINASALDFGKYVQDEIDNFIISIPFTFLKKEDAQKLVKSCFKFLKPKSYYSQVVYRENTLLSFIGSRTFEKKIVKAIINEKIFHIKND